MIAVRHPELVRRVALYGATFGPPQDALNPEMTNLDQPPAADSRSIQFQRDSYRKIAPDPHYSPKIFEKLGGLQWNGFSREDLRSEEHTSELQSLMRNSYAVSCMKHKRNGAQSHKSNKHNTK